MSTRVQSTAQASGESFAISVRPPVLQRRCACGGSAGPEGTCADCAGKERFGGGASVALGQPGDQFEAAADWVADQVMNGSAPDVQRMEDDEDDTLQRMPAGGQQMGPQEDEEDEETVRRKATGPAAPAPAAVSSAANALSVSGQPLPSAERAFFEPRFGRDLGHVRLHTGPAAQRAARAIHARAYTLHNNIAFAPGAYVPGTQAGRRLMAHELAHTMQQGAGSGASGVVRRFSEREHTRIGEKAYQKAYSRVNSIPTGPQMPAIDSAFVNSLRNFRFQSAKKGALNYGQLVAVADKIASFELLEEKNNSGAPDIPLLAPIWNWIGNKTHYVDLAARNRAHFHPHNYLSWQPWHWQALKLMHKASELSANATALKRDVRTLLKTFKQHDQAARRAIKEVDALAGTQANGTRTAELDRQINRHAAAMHRLVSQAQQKQAAYTALRTQASDTATKAMAMNGFGDHFLTDAFSAGHIVTPRKELLDEYSTRLLGVLPVGGVLHCANIPSLAWHDLDNKFGLTVDNANGQEWEIFGDNFADKGALPGGRSLSPTMKHVVDATATSISQMWQAAGGKTPSSLLPVLNQLPRPKFSNYPRWTPADWNLQLRYAAGEQVGANYDALSSAPRPQRPSVKVPNPKGEQLGKGPLSFRATCLNLLPKFSYSKFVVPMIARIRRDYATRYFTGRKGQIVSPDVAPTPQASVTGHVVLGSLIGGAAGIGLGLLAGALIGGGLALALGGIIGGAVGLLGGGFIGGLLGARRDKEPTANAGGKT